MAFDGVVGPNVMDSSTTTGTGTLTLAGAITGHNSVGTYLANGDKGYFFAYDVDANGNPSGDWEEFYGTYTSSGTTLSRDTIFKSSNSNNAVSWAAGTRRIALIDGPARSKGVGMTVNGVFLPGAKFRRTWGSNLSTGSNDLYTVPAGKRAWVGAPTVFNPSAGTIAWYVQIKVSGTYYLISVTTSTTTGLGTSNINAGSIILEAGEILSVNTATTNGLNIWFPVIEFDATAGLKTSKVVACASGDNTIYTCPTGKSAMIFGQAGVMNFGVGNVSIFAAYLHFVADGGGTRNVIPYLVPSGGSSGTTNKAQASTAVTAGLRSAVILINATLDAGDFIVLNVDTGNAAQIAWVNVLEVVLP